MHFILKIIDFEKKNINLIKIKFILNFLFKIDKNALNLLK